MSEFDLRPTIEGFETRCLEAKNNLALAPTKSDDEAEDLCDEYIVALNEARYASAIYDDDEKRLCWEVICAAEGKPVINMSILYAIWNGDCFVSKEKIRSNESLSEYSSFGDYTVYRDESCCYR